MEETTDVSKKSVAIKWGLISSIIGIIIFLIQDFAGIAGDQSMGMVVLAISVIITTTIIFMAHKEYKEGGDGYMSYGEGLGLGTLLSLVSGIIVSIFTYVYVSFINPQYMENMREQQIIAMEEQGMTDSQIEQGMAMAENFSGPVAMLIFGILGAVFTGFLVSLLVSAFTKNSRPEFE